MTDERDLMDPYGSHPDELRRIAVRYADEVRAAGGGPLAGLVPSVAAAGALLELAAVHFAARERFVRRMRAAVEDDRRRRARLVVGLLALLALLAGALLVGRALAPRPAHHSLLAPPCATGHRAPGPWKLTPTATRVD